METMNKALFWLSEKIDSIGENRRDFAKNEKNGSFVKLSAKFMNLERCISALKEEDQKTGQFNLVSKIFSRDKNFFRIIANPKSMIFQRKKSPEIARFCRFRCTNRNPPMRRQTSSSLTPHRKI